MTRRTMVMAGMISLALAVLSRPAEAEEVNYFFVGTGSGQMGGVAFTDAAFTIVLSADTVDACQCPGPGIFHIIGPSTIDIEGFPTAAFLIATRVFSNNNNNALGFSRASGLDLLDLQDAAFAGYQLETSLGPVFEDNPFAVNQFADIETDLGLLTFDDIPDVTFEAVVGDPSLPEFIRGDADGNGSVTALVDGLFLLSFGFAQGPEPPCFAAADFDGDDDVSALVDGIGILNFGFVPGSPPPAPPYPDCGSDLMTTLPCDGFTGCP